MLCFENRAPQRQQCGQKSRQNFALLPPVKIRRGLFEVQPRCKLLARSNGPADLTQFPASFGDIFVQAEASAQCRVELPNYAKFREDVAHYSAPHGPRRDGQGGGTCPPPMTMPASMGNGVGKWKSCKVCWCISNDSRGITCAFVSKHSSSSGGGLCPRHPSGLRFRTPLGTEATHP